MSTTRLWYGRERASGILIGWEAGPRRLKALLDDGREVLVELPARSHFHGPMDGRRVEVGVHSDPEKPARIIRVEQLLDFLRRRELERNDPEGDTRVP